MPDKTLTYEFEQQFREVEGVKLVVRQPQNEPVKEAYDYQRKLSGASTVSKLRERVKEKLGHNNFELLDENLNPLHGLSKLDGVRKDQEHTLPK